MTRTPRLRERDEPPGRFTVQLPPRGFLLLSATGRTRRIRGQRTQRSTAWTPLDKDDLAIKYARVETMAASLRIYAFVDAHNSETW